MKTKLLIFCLLTSALVARNAQAGPGQEGDLTADDIKSRLEIKGEVYLLDPSGKRILEKDGEMIIWKPRVVEGPAEIDNYWGGPSVRNLKAFIHHKWAVQSDGSIKLTIEEYAREEEYKKPDGRKDTRFADLVRKEERVLENLEQINWVTSKSTPKGRFLVKFTPNLNEEVRPKKLVELPISGTDIQITDNEGGLWIEHAGLNGKYVGLTTYKGSVFLSYFPFSGAKEIGVAAGNKIELRLGGKKTATVTSQTAFVPADVRTIVYGIYNPDKKTSRITSVHTRVSSTEKKFLESIKDEDE